MASVDAITADLTRYGITLVDGSWPADHLQVVHDALQTAGDSLYTLASEHYDTATLKDGASIFSDVFGPYLFSHMAFIPGEPHWYAEHFGNNQVILTNNAFFPQESQNLMDGYIHSAHFSNAFSKQFLVRHEIGHTVELPHTLPKQSTNGWNRIDMVEAYRKTSQPIIDAVAAALHEQPGDISPYFSADFGSAGFCMAARTLPSDDQNPSLLVEFTADATANWLSGPGNFTGDVLGKLRRKQMDGLMRMALQGTYDPAAAFNDLQLIAETIGDGMVVTPGQKLSKQWQVYNSGRSDWKDCQLAFFGGDQMGAPASVPIPPTKRYRSATVSVDLVAPAQPGPAKGYWQAQDAHGVPFGLIIWVAVIVK